ncbi:hypothetical protein GSS88_00470 [Corynebacterium sp. 3HC-13]|nr:NADPH-dependent FMN reductase [Corynebacterium poyangense]MBZ8176282.1 hypothetical protein [Corynebacterium poyangense]
MNEFSSKIGVGECGEARRPIMILAGSHRIGWHTSALAAEAARQLREKGHSVDFVEVSALDLPMHNPEDHQNPHASGDSRVRGFADRIQAASAFIFVTPIYHGSYSSWLKRVIDHFTISLVHDKPMAIMVHGGGRFSGSAIEHLRSICVNLHGRLINTAVATNVGDFSADNGTLRVSNDIIVGRVERVVEQINAENIRS